MRFATVSSGAGENARLIYVNLNISDDESLSHKYISVTTYKRFTRLPSKFFPQELYHCLKAIRSSNLVEVLLHDWRVSYGLKTYYDCLDRYEHQVEQACERYNVPFDVSLALYVSSAANASGFTSEALSPASAPAPSIGDRPAEWTSGEVGSESGFAILSPPQVAQCFGYYGFDVGIGLNFD